MKGKSSLIVLGFMLTLITQSCSGNKCKSTEILSDNGCVDREGFLNRIIMRSWKDQGFEKAKARAGLVDDMQCKPGEVRTPFGCSKPPFPPRRESARVEIHHSRLEHNQIVHDGAGFKVKHHEEEGESKPVRKRRSEGPPIYGHDRPRKYVFLPGRNLHPGFKCRPNEVLGRKGRCIKKRRAVKQKQHEKVEKIEQSDDHYYDNAVYG